MKNEWGIYTFEKTQKLWNGIELQPIGSVMMLKDYTRSNAF